MLDQLQRELESESPSLERLEAVLSALKLRDIAPMSETKERPPPADHDMPAWLRVNASFVALPHGAKSVSAVLLPNAGPTRRLLQAVVVGPEGRAVSAGLYIFSSDRPPQLVTEVRALLLPRLVSLARESVEVFGSEAAPDHTRGPEDRLARDAFFIVEAARLGSPIRHLTAAARAMARVSPSSVPSCTFDLLRAMSASTEPAPVDALCEATCKALVRAVTSNLDPADLMSDPYGPCTRAAREFWLQEGGPDHQSSPYMKLKALSVARTCLGPKTVPVTFLSRELELSVRSDGAYEVGCAPPRMKARTAAACQATGPRQSPR